MARKSKARFQMKGHSIPGVKGFKSTALKDGRVASSAFQQQEIEESFIEGMLESGTNKKQLDDGDLFLIGKKRDKDGKIVDIDFTPPKRDRYKEVPREKEGESPMKSFLGLGKDNREIRQKNRAARQQYKEDVKDWREKKRLSEKGMGQGALEKRKHEIALQNWKEERAKGTSSGGDEDFKEAWFDKGLGLGGYLNYNEKQWLREQGRDNSAEKKGLSNREKRKRRDEIRREYLEDYELKNPRPIYEGEDLLKKPERPTREKLDYNWKLPISRSRTAHNIGNPEFED